MAASIFENRPQPTCDLKSLPQTTKSEQLDVVTLIFFNLFWTITWAWTCVESVRWLDDVKVIVFDIPPGLREEEKRPAK